MGAWSMAKWTRVTGVKRANTTAAGGIAVAPWLPGMCRSGSRRERRTCRWIAAYTSHPTTVSMAHAAIRAGVSSHPGLMAAGFLIQRQPGSTVIGCS
jgi:hypothetical protein